MNDDQLTVEELALRITAVKFMTFLVVVQIAALAGWMIIGAPSKPEPTACVLTKGDMLPALFPRSRFPRFMDFATQPMEKTNEDASAS